MLFAAVDPFEHVMDSPHWHFFETLHWKFHLPGFVTKFMVLELLAAGLILLIYIPLAKRLRAGTPARGALRQRF